MKKSAWGNKKITEKHIVISFTFSQLELFVTETEESCHILLLGGEIPHIGSVVISQPRPSLRYKGKLSCTSSVWNQCGHKDEILCKMIAEKTAITKNKLTVCTGGFHIKNITDAQIKEMTERMQELIL